MLHKPLIILKLLIFFYYYRAIIRTKLEIGPLIAAKTFSRVGGEEEEEEKKLQL